MKSRVPRVLITGTTSGIGRGLMASYHRQEWDIVAFNRREDKELESQFPGVQFVHIDVQDRVGIQNYFREASAKNQIPEVYYLNAGINKVDNLDGFSLDTFQEVMATNLGGVLNFVDAALPYLSGKKAVFVVSSSTSNIFPNPNNLGYYLSKVAVEKMFRMFDQRYAKKGWVFKVLILSPIATNIFVGGKLASKLQMQIRNFLTVSVDEAVPAIVKFVQSRRKVFYYTNTAVVFFCLTALIKKIIPGFYQGSANVDVEKRDSPANLPRLV